MSKLPAAPAEVPVQSDTSLLAPFFREAVERVVADMKAWGYTPQIFETMRTNERQAFLYGFGRTYDDGRGVVTHSQSADDTWHGYGLAVDIICARRKWDVGPHFWNVLGTSARSTTKASRTGHTFSGAHLGEARLPRPSNCERRADSSPSGVRSPRCRKTSPYRSPRGSRYGVFFCLPLA